MRQISSDSSTQTNRLIDAASQMKDAAWNFKGSAEGIDGNLANAVAKLQTQTETAQKSVESARDALRLEQRAWVGVIGSNVTGGQITGQALQDKTFAVGELHIYFRNSGRTPATNMAFLCCDVANISWQQIPRKVAPQELTEVGAGNGVLAPDAVRDISVIQSTGFLMYAPDTPPAPAFVYVRGRITYRDVFAGTPEHTTWFCFRHTTGLMFDFCPNGNSMN